MEIELGRVWRIIVEKCLRAKPGERVLIVTDTLQKETIPKSIMRELHAIGVEAGMVVMSARKVGDVESPRFVAEALKACDAALLTPVRTITYSRAVRDAREEGVRVLGVIGLSEDALLRTVDVNYKELRESGTKIARMLKQTSTVTIASPEGTDLKIRLAGREPKVVDGMVTEPGEIDWLPPGSVYVAVKEGTAEGTYIANGSIQYWGVLKEPIKLTVENGYVTRIEGGDQAREYEKMLKKLGDPNAYSVGEYGLGLNPAAKITGFMVEDERVLGSTYIGVGQNIVHGGVTEAKVHIDIITLGSSVKFDDKTIIKDGELIVK